MSVPTAAALRRTPLDAEHRSLGGKIVPFAGWAMPVQYPSGIQAEHRAVREAAGLFDVSHMGEFGLEGPDAEELLLKLTVNDVSSIETGQAQYSALCLPEGTILDDLLIYRTGASSFLLVVNASNRDMDWAWISEHARDLDLILEDRSDRIALLALQGPASEAILEPIAKAGVPLPELGYYRFTNGEVAGFPALIARTGYTGEDGFELYLAWEDAVPVWRALLDAGRTHGLIPAGLGARDSLRLEVGFPLHGNDLDTEHTALESALGWIVKMNGDRDFIGREALARQKEEGVRRRLVGLRLEGRGFPRPGHPVVADGEEVGVVTSGTVSPMLGYGIALARIRADFAKPGTEVAVRIRDRDIPGVTARPPFYTEGSIRR